jgi:hypothetical protein
MYVVTMWRSSLMSVQTCCNKDILKNSLNAIYTQLVLIFWMRNVIISLYGIQQSFYIKERIGNVSESTVLVPKQAAS